MKSFDGFKYFVTFVDDFTRITWIYVLKLKSELFQMFLDFHTLVATQYSSKISVLRSDNGSEYLSNKMKSFLSSHGIIHQTSCVGTPQQNGIAERKNRDILEKTRAIMFQMNIPKEFWSQVVLTATYLINRLPSRVLEFKSPLEKLKGRKIDLTHLRTFGCVCFVHIQSKHRDKLDPRAAKCIFLGYASTQKGYKCFNPITKKLVVSRDVRFEESTPWYTDRIEVDGKGELYSDLNPLPISDAFIDTSPAQNTVTAPANSSAQNPVISPDTSPVQPPISDSDDNGNSGNEECDPQVVADDDENQAIISPADPPVVNAPRRNPSRNRNKPARFKDYVMMTSKHPITKSYTHQRLSSSHRAFLSSLDNVSNPQTFDEANMHSEWRQAMSDELKALHDNQTWSIVKLLAGKKAVGCKWIFKTKFH